MSSSEIVMTQPNDEHAFLNHAASYNHLPDLAAAQAAAHPGLRRTFSDLTHPTQSDSLSKEDVAAGKDILRRTSIRSKNKPTIAVSRFTVSAEDLSDSTTGSEATSLPAKKPTATRPPSPVARPSKARSMSGRLVSLARKPWLSNSPPSGKSSRLRSLRTEEQSTLNPPVASSRSSRSSLQSDSGTESESAAPTRRRTILNKRPRRPMVAVVTQSRFDGSSSPSNSSPQSLMPKTSLEKLAASLNVSTPVLPPVPKTPATANLAASMEFPRKKDDLWGVFRNLEADFQKFQSKSSALKANVIRSSLLPFLNRSHSHSSFKQLRPEDLDRRVNILNKWWIGLMEMLNGKNNQSISGTDRPVYLEAVVGIMTRPEWRIPFPMPPSSRNFSRSLTHASTSISESSDGSSSSDFLLESIHHNIRNIFIQNLLSQMAFVVERMSMRHAPASLVAFCGKACAYAFFFCPGVADILVRLWNTPPSVFRRVLDQSKLDKGSGTRALAQELTANFPAALRSLSFYAHTALVRYLRQKPDVPLSTAQIPWQSPWATRWCGRDTDLFFVFVKYIHVLYADALPPELEKSKRILAPGLLPIHSQLLVVLEDTLYKQSVPQVPDSTHTASAVTFDDFIEGADAAVSALPLGTANSHRLMAENRLIILLRDFLSESSLEPNHARLLYAESFGTIMRAAAEKTSLFDHNACFLLCDFVEEVIPIVTRYSLSIEADLFDWKFWLEVCRQMMQSHNSLTEVRVFAFLFCIWSTWTASEERKADLCLKFLLDESLFYHYFSHWSPMVRAYFQRLLCWRLGRFSDDPTMLDTTIYETLYNRLQRTWKYYQAFQAKAEEEISAPLSSAPCTPAPGRRIIIIRCDNQLSPSSFFVSFDRVIPPAPAEKSTLAGSALSKPEPAENQPPTKKKWSILRAMFGGSSNSRTGGEGSSSSSSDESDSSGSDAVGTAEKPPDNQWRQPNGPGELGRPRTAHQPYSFKFSLEWMDRPQWPSKNKRLFTPCLPVGSQLHLQLRKALAKQSECDTTSEYVSATEGDDDAMSDGRQTSPYSDDQDETPTEDTADSDKTTDGLDFKLALNDRFAASKYAGRALAEWAQIVSECDNFFARRRDEGVPCDRLVETPTLGVESFRK
ncbi:hypothetical protein ASPACDRAFT_21244 [Aspergillus aculeatus ATCC 16872]|uniref:DUF1765-domain-containing protein n=1 Tax=Aspergillus aculeatus (strain ATCC 16872 / CBS 172.66 / WB 5094) TaxID=690307 RepID=A0A1L9XA40_ASPA1|nr:uncharacterized protein ASPACDRAFT_21244 [Aspergillus aculeatus ATCC 16872]OJK05224.1 hypothetical protein ASPACDRAFT_21244 [Aspergillus aculeatus ATCC 16872]